METNFENKDDPEQASILVDGEQVLPPSPKGCCGFFRFDGVKTAIGENYLAAARGPIVMSNVFLATSFLYLASKDAGCLTDDDRIDRECETRVYGFLPISFLSNIAVISGLISAFCMPVIGAIVDHTDHRTMLGIVASVLICIVQAIQIGTVLDTYFIMGILQAIAAFLFQVVVLVVYSFFPYVARIVGKDSIAKHTVTWTMTQFFTQAMFIVLVIVVSIAFNTNDVVIAHISQALCIVCISPLFYLGWRLFPKMPKSHELPEGHSLLTEGFRQNWRTIKNISTHYRRSLGFYFLGVAFAEAATNTFTVVANTFLIDVLGFTGTQVGIFFLITLLCTLPGSKLGSYVTIKTNPSISWRLSMVGLAIVANIGVVVLDMIPPERSYLSYIWGAFVGLFLGWFYPTENCFFSLIVPKEQETELAGFWVYCSQIIGWLPPLIFSIIVENGYHQKWGLMAVTVFYVPAITILTLQGSWSDIISDNGEDFSSGHMVKNEDFASTKEKENDAAGVIPVDTKISSARKQEEVDNNSEASIPA